MPELIERVPGTRFLVAGSGTHEQELKKQATELGLMEHGTFLGWIGDDVLHLLYRIADVCVVPSIYEPFGLVALEAMASGCPCIVADTGGLREVVPHGEVGLRFRTRDPEALGGMVERVLTDAELREGLSPRPASTSSASTGATSPAAPPRSTGSWRGRRPWPRPPPTDRPPWQPPRFRPQWSCHVHAERPMHDRGALLARGAETGSAVAHQPTELGWSPCAGRRGPAPERRRENDEYRIDNRDRRGRA